MKRAPEIHLAADEISTLSEWSRGGSTPARLVLRAKIVLMAGDGWMNKDIAAELHIAPKTVSLWRRRFADGRLAGIEKDAPRAGRHPKQRERIAHRIMEATLLEPPARGARWTTRTLAKHLGCSPSMVQRVWKASGLKPYLLCAVRPDDQFAFLETSGKVAVSS